MIVRKSLLWNDKGLYAATGTGIAIVGAFAQDLSGCYAHNRRVGPPIFA